MKLAVVQIRGTIKVNKRVKDTLKYLGLIKKNSCVVLDNVPSVLGMLIKVKDYVAWGEIDNETLEVLLTKRGRLPGGVGLSSAYLKDKIKKDMKTFVLELNESKMKIKDVPGLKRYFRLTPPVGGFGNKGTKQPFSLGGALGYRGTKINDLIKRMV